MRMRFKCHCETIKNWIKLADRKLHPMDQVRVHVGILVELKKSNFEQKQC